jgi:hypothetical protein
MVTYSRAAADVGASHAHIDHRRCRASRGTVNVAPGRMMRIVVAQRS